MRRSNKGNGFRVIISDAGREPSPSDDLCIEAITDEWSSRAAAGFVVQVIDVGKIPNEITPETERFLLRHGWRHANEIQPYLPVEAKAES